MRFWPLLILAGLQGACAGRAPAVSPVQPVDFSHRVHAGTNRIGCLACHVYARHSPAAGIPAMSVCAGCHRFIGGDKPEVRKLLQAVEDDKPLAWVQVNRLPDHVRFNHARHLQAGFECRHCHGAVETMDADRPVVTMNMGWCLDCHRIHQGPRDCLVCHK